MDYGTAVDIIDLNELNLPVYNNDMESNPPEGVKKLRIKLLNSDVVFIASPEHNFSITAALKNAIDWVSRMKPNPLDGKTAAIFGVSGGHMGTVRGQLHLRQILSYLNTHILPQPQVCIPYSETAFDPDGSLKTKTLEDMFIQLIKSTLDFAQIFKK